MKNAAGVRQKRVFRVYSWAAYKSCRSHFKTPSEILQMGFLFVFCPAFARQNSIMSFVAYH